MKCAKTNKFRNNTAYVADIQRASIHDGPGIRTTIFFKGCPLNCIWCHNPECINSKPQLLVYPEKCIGCGMCDKGCFSGARVVCGKEMTPEEIFKEIVLDKAYYGVDGGVTFSGGEPLMHPQILKELICLCKKEGIHTAIETSLLLFDEDIFKNIDFVMADFKIWDDKMHQKFTGVSNKAIKEHFQMLDCLNVPFVVRTPIVPGINDTMEEIISIRNYIKVFNNIKDYELLPYHPLGVEKQKALGVTETMFPVPDRQKMEVLQRYANLQGQN